jgi:putative transposase
MARQPRFVIPNQPHHIIQRGNNRQIVFCATTDYHHYLEKLLSVSEKYNCKIHAYVPMSNHVHLLVTPLKEDGISQMMQTLGTYYARYFNYHYQRTGTLFEGRYKSIPIDTEQYLFTCMRYIELNPVRAQMVHTPSEYK